MVVALLIKGEKLHLKLNCYINILFLSDQKKLNKLL